MRNVLFAAAILWSLAGSANARPPNTIPAFYDGDQFNITFKELPPGGEAAVEAHNESINIIYQCDSCSFGFISVIDAIQGDGFNPLWEEWQINFVPPNQPHQFFSDNEVLAAYADGEITLTDTEEVYVCAVVGPKKK